jgi:hypothetical protein
MPTSLASSTRTQPAATTDHRFWFLLALPVLGLAVAVVTMNPSAAGVSSVIVEVAAAGV